MAVPWPILLGGQSRGRRPRSPRWIGTRLSEIGQRFLIKATAGTTSTLDHAEAFDRLFQRHEQQIFGYLWRMTGDQALASDLCQETFLRAWQRFEQLSTYQDVAGWLFRVVTNLALNAERRRQRLLRLVTPLDDEDGPIGAAPTGSIVDAALVHQILQGLSPRARAALVLREVYDLSIDEVARTLNATPAATKKMLSRAREQFRTRYLQEDTTRGQ
jgi:RNA polymerase sigma-70 factor (ECF subfamily)